MTQIGFGFVIFFASISGGGSGVRHVVSLPGRSFCKWCSSFPFNAGVAMTSFPLVISIWVRRVPTLVPFQRKQVAALVPALRRHGAVDLFSGRGVRSSTAARSVPAWLLLRRGRTFCRRFLLPLHRFLRREAVSCVGWWVCIPCVLLLPAQRFLIDLELPRYESTKLAYTAISVCTQELTCFCFYLNS